jgi:hypothetical protein
MGVRAEFRDVTAEASIQIYPYAPDIVGGSPGGNGDAFNGVRHRHSPKAGPG